MNTIQIKDKKFVPYIDRKKIQEAIQKVAARINEDLVGQNPLFICVLNGAFVFAADLFREITIDSEITFMRMKSYSGTQSTGRVKEIQGLGVFIDVFPMDIVKLSSNNQRKLERKVKKVLTLLELSNMKKCWPANGVIKNITKNAIFFYVKLRGTRYWYKKYEKLIFNAQQKNESKKEQYIFAWSILEKDDFGNGVLLKYEKNRYSCPCNFDKYLKKEYGNYMEFPPEKDRKSVHDFDAYFKN